MRAFPFPRTTASVLAARSTRVVAGAGTRRHARARRTGRRSRRRAATATAAQAAAAALRARVARLDGEAVVDVAHADAAFHQVLDVVLGLAIDHRAVERHGAVAHVHADVAGVDL